MVVVVDLEYLASGMVKYLSAILACIFTPMLIIGCVVGNQAPASPPAEKVFQILADEGHPDKTGRIIFIKNTKTGECHLMTRMNSGTALAPALCEKK